MSIPGALAARPKWLFVDNVLFLFHTRPEAEHQEETVRVPASTALFRPEMRHGRSIEARRVARQKKFERERVIVDSLNRGLPVAEIAERIGVTQKRMRALVRDILAHRMPEAPEDYAALQISRLNEALAVAYSAMSPQNLKAVALVVRIVRELDRYHGFVPAARPCRRGEPSRIPGTTRSRPRRSCSPRSRRPRRRQTGQDKDAAQRLGGLRRLAWRG